MAARKKAAKTDGPAKKPAKVTDSKVIARNEELNRTTVELIKSTALGVHKEIGAHRKPDLAFPVRSLGNVKYDQKVGYFELGRHTKQRALSVNTVKNFAQTLRLMSISKEMVENDDFATKREAYYVSKNWGDCKFDDQPESDAVMDDIEALASLGLAYPKVGRQKLAELEAARQALLGANGDREHVKHAVSAARAAG